MDKHVFRYRTGARGIFVGIMVNLALAIFKGLIGHVSQSRAMMADALHSGSDFLAMLVVLIALRISCRPADIDHPYGHWKAESLAQNIVGFLIILAGAGVVFSSIVGLRETPHPPGSLALWGALFSLLLKEGLYQYTIRIGRRINSGALVASAWEHRSDAYSSLAALLGILGARLGLYWGIEWLFYLDTLAGLAVAGLILRMGFSIMFEASGELMEEMVDEETQEEICRLCLSVDGVMEVNQVRARRAGPSLLVDMEIEVSSSMSIVDGHDVAHAVETKLMQEKEEIDHVMVHVQPCIGGQKNVTGK